MRREEKRPNICKFMQQETIKEDIVSSIWFLCWYVIVLLPLNLRAFMLMTDMARVNNTRQNDLPTNFCQLNFWQDWKIGQGRQVSMWVIILLPSTSRNSWAMYPLLLISLETSPGLPAYSVGHEKLIWTPLWDCRTIGVMMIKDEPAKHGRKSESWKLYECLSVAM